jgi:hypothetical protein
MRNSDYLEVFVEIQTLDQTGLAWRSGTYRQTLRADNGLRIGAAA